MIYIASPYSHPDTEVIHERFLQAAAAVSHLTNKGQVVYSPIVHFHPVAVLFQLPGDFAFWKRHNLEMLGHASDLYVLQLDGWKESIGVQAEIAYARDLNLPTIFMERIGG